MNSSWLAYLDCRVRLGHAQVLLAVLSLFSASLPAPRVQGEDAQEDFELIEAFVFGARRIDCPSNNDETRRYTAVQHGSALDLAYRSRRGWGYEVIYSRAIGSPDFTPYLDTPAGSRGDFATFGPFDHTPNLRSAFDGLDCWEEIYDSHIGISFLLSPCDRFITNPPDRNLPCHLGDARVDPEGIVFRVDVPNGFYRFVASVGDAQAPHAHCLIAENGGSGGPAELGPDHVFLVRNFDQAIHPIGDVPNAGGTAFALGKGVYARVGFDGRIPPPGDGRHPSPRFVDIGRDGLVSTTGVDSPVLRVTRGSIRIHQLQGNSNDGPGGFDRRRADANGADLNVLELWRLELASFRRGDANLDGRVDLSDALRILGFLFLGSPTELECERSADVDDTGVLQISDAVYLLSFLFLAAPPPPGPFPDCGVPLRPEGLPCATNSACS